MPSISGRMIQMALATLSRAEHFTEEYRENAESIGEAVRKEHDRAMIVCDVEDLVGLGIFVTDMWFRHVERWHEWVSEDKKRYQKDIHETLRRLEIILVEAVRKTLEAISCVKKWGFEIDDEKEFRECADQLLACTQPLADPHCQEQIRTLGKEAVQEYKASQLQEIKHWGE